MPDLGTTSSHIKYKPNITAAAATAEAAHPPEKILTVGDIPYKNSTVFNLYL